MSMYMSQYRLFGHLMENKAEIASGPAATPGWFYEELRFGGELAVQLTKKINVID